MSVVLYRSDMELVARLLSSLRLVDRLEKVWILHSDCGSDRCTLLPELRAGADRFVVICRGDNLGFAGGHNFLLRQAFTAGADAVLVGNPDLVIAPTALDDLAQAAFSFESSRLCPAVHGPRLYLEDRSRVSASAPSYEIVDSDGIRWTKDRRHFDIAQGVKADDERRSVEREGVTGAALFVTRSSYTKIVSLSGYFFDPYFVAYREDAELGLRVLEIGGTCVVHRVAGFVHARGSINGARSSPIQKLLGAQNRFLLKYRLTGSHAGRNGPRALLRDLGVLAIALLRERPSWTGIRMARRVRRAERYKGAWLVAQRSASR